MLRPRIVSFPYLSLLLTFLLLQSCGWGGGDDKKTAAAPTPIETISVAVEAEGLPLTIDMESVQIIAGLTSNSLTEAQAGGVKLKPEAPQLLTLADENGDILLMGLSLYSSEGSLLSLSPVSTAQALVFLNPFFAALLYKGKEADMAVVATVAELPEVQALAALVGQRLTEGSFDYLTADDSQLKAALTAAIEAALVALPSAEAPANFPSDQGRLPSSLQIVAPVGDRGMVSVEDSLLGGSLHRFTLTNSAQRYLQAELVKEDGTLLGEPDKIYIGPASNLVSFTPLYNSSGSMEVDATALANNQAKLKIYAPGRGMDQVPWEKVQYPLLNTITTEFAAPLLGLLVPWRVDCLVNLASNLNGMMLNESIIQSTMRSYIEGGDTLSAVLYYVKEMNTAFWNNKSDVRTLSLSECYSSEGNDILENKVKEALAKFGTIAGRAVIAYKLATTTAELSASFSSVFFNPAYMEWQVNNYLRVEVNTDTDYGSHDANFLAYCSPGTTCGSVTWNFGDGTVQESESGQLITHTYAADGEYTVTISLTDADNATSTEDPAAMSTVLTISSAPQVVSTTPADGDSEVSPEEEVKITFSQNMDPSTVTPYNLFMKRLDSDGSDDGAPIDALFFYDEATRTATLEPETPLAKNSIYRVYVGVGSGMKSADGVLLLSVKKFDFSTPDDLPPEVVDTSPYSGGFAEVNPEIRAVFSEPVAPASLTAGSFTLVDGDGQAVAGTLSLSTDNITALFTLAGDLEKESVYTATLNNVMDLSGNVIASPYSWSFTTATGQGDLEGLAMLAERTDGIESFVLKSLDGENELKIDNIYNPGSGFFTPDGHLVLTSGYWPYGGALVATGYIIKPPLIPKPNGTWEADIEETFYNYTSTDDKYAEWSLRLAELLAVEGTCIGIAKGTVTDPDQWVENENLQLWSGDCGAPLTQLTHVGRSDLEGSADVNEPDYNPNYGNLNYHPEVFCSLGRTSCSAYGNFYYYSGAYSHVTEIISASLAADDSIWFTLSSDNKWTLSYDLFQLNGGTFNHIRQLDPATTPYYPGSAKIYPDRNLLLAAGLGFMHLTVETLDGSFTKHLYPVPPYNPSVSSVSLRFPDGGGNILTELDSWIHGDTDNDGIDNWDEHLKGLDGGKADTDNDGLEDGEELARDTDPKDWDTDNDGLPDGQEVSLYSTDPLKVDTDGDFVSDRDEITLGTDPLLADEDSDLDGLSNEDEHDLGTDPLNTDSDGDGLSDAGEVDSYTSPLGSDTDGDGLVDGAEVDNGFDPRLAETTDHDNDGVSSSDEVHFGTDPLDPSQTPIVGYTLTELTAYGIFANGNISTPPLTSVRGDENYMVHELPWDFPFYGLTVTTVTGDTNGNIWLSDYDESEYGFNLATASRPVLTLWNADLDSGDGGMGLQIYQEDDPPQLIFNWDTETYSESGDGLVNTLEGVLYPNGFILYRYIDFTTLEEEDDGSGISLANGIDYLDQSAQLEIKVPQLGERVFLYEPLLAGDSDGDGLTDSEELDLGTNPDEPDSNSDGIKDGWHIYILDTDPLSLDSDGDGLDNAAEQILGTNPVMADSDGDGIDDPAEIARDGVPGSYQAGVDTDPADPDTDHDGAKDGAEVAAGFDPLVSQVDHDNDGVDSLTEAANGTDPLAPDTDSDGLGDAVETNTGTYIDANDTGTDPLEADSDDDGLKDGVETASGVFVDAGNTGSQPLMADSDNDGTGDGGEVLFGSDPNDAESQPVRFSEAATLATVTRIVNFGLRDMDGDNSVDLIQGYDSSDEENSLALLRNDGSGTFSNPELSAVPGRHSDMLLTDINGDGDFDAIFSNHENTTLTPMLNDGAGNFSAGTDLDTGSGSSPGLLAQGDFNEDGRPDFVALDRNDSTIVHLLLSDGSGGYGSSSLGISAVAYPVCAVSGDFDGDGHQDLAVGSDSYDYLVYLNYGDGIGGFPRRSELNANYYVKSLTTADLNHDGLPELIGIVDYSLLAVWLNSNSGFLPITTYRSIAHGAWPTVADFNGDGRLDIAGINYDGLTIWLGDGDGGLYPTGYVSAGIGMLAGGDLDGDGRPDIAVSDRNNWSADYGLTLWHNDSNFGVDTDSDGLSDRAEEYLGCDINITDSDGDGLSDGLEFYLYHTDPSRGDSDEDGASDGEEVAVGTDPLSAYSP